MIRIEYDEKTLTLDIRGHANFANYGQDIVCAAISVLGQTLVNNLIRFSGRGWYRLEWQAEEGNLHIHCEANGYYDMVVEMFRFVMVGFRMIAVEYADYVTIKETGGEKQDGGI